MMTGQNPPQVIGWQCGHCDSINEDINKLLCNICKTRVPPLWYENLGGPINPIVGRKWWAKDADSMDPKTPPRQRKEEGKSNTPSTETIKQLPLPRRHQLAKLDEKYYNDLCCMHLRCHIGKIKELQTDMIEGYGKYLNMKKVSICQRKSRPKLNFYSSIALNTGAQRCI